VKCILEVSCTSRIIGSDDTRIIIVDVGNHGLVDCQVTKHVRTALVLHSNRRSYTSVFAPVLRMMMA
jgi:hypothetical protein